MSDPRIHSQIESTVNSTQAIENFFKRVKAGALGQQAALHKLDELGKWFNLNPYSFFTQPEQYQEFNIVLADTITLIEEGRIKGFKQTDLPRINDAIPGETGYFRNIKTGFQYNPIYILNP